jgi:hypothetical protein
MAYFYKLKNEFGHASNPTSTRFAPSVGGEQQFRCAVMFRVVKSLFWKG